MSRRVEFVVETQLQAVSVLQKQKHRHSNRWADRWAKASGYAMLFFASLESRAATNILAARPGPEAKKLYKYRRKAVTNHSRAAHLLSRGCLQHKFRDCLITSTQCSWSPYVYSGFTLFEQQVQSKMKLAELLLQRVQLQNDLNDQAGRIQANAQVLEGEEPLEDPELILKDYWTTTEALETMQRRIQDINVKASFDDTRSVSHALVHREILRKQIQTLTAVLSAATVNSRYSTKDIKRVAVLNVPDLREKLSSVRKESQQMDIQIQKRNWDIDVP